MVRKVFSLTCAATISAMAEWGFYLILEGPALQQLQMIGGLCFMFALVLKTIFVGLLYIPSDRFYFGNVLFGVVVGHVVSSGMLVDLQPDAIVVSHVFGAFYAMGVISLSVLLRKSLRNSSDLAKA